MGLRPTLADGTRTQTWRPSGDQPTIRRSPVVRMNNVEKLGSLTATPRFPPVQLDRSRSDCRGGCRSQDGIKPYLNGKTGCPRGESDQTSDAWYVSDSGCCSA